MREQHEVKVTGGIGMFFYGLVPGAVAGGLLLWLAFVTGCLDMQQQRTIAQRMDNRVGVVQKSDTMNKPVSLIVRQPDCMKIVRAYIDGADDSSMSYGGKLTVYIKNECGRQQYGYEWHWQEVAPDGTIIHGSSPDSSTVPLPEATLEATENLPDDNRVTKVVVWADRTMTDKQLTNYGEAK